MVRSFFFLGITGKLNHNSFHSFMQAATFGWWYKSTLAEARDYGCR